MDFEYRLTIKTMANFLDFGDKKHGGSFKPDFCTDKEAMKNKSGFVVVYRDKNSFRYYWGETKEGALRTFFKENKDWK